MIDFDPAKDEINQRKHGISLARAIEIDLGTAVIRVDDRRDSGEPRWRAYAMLEGKLHMLAFTLRHGGVRVISLRRANARETKRYG